jgi:hypothetical protein
MTGYKSKKAAAQALAQPEQERTDYAVHLNHCNIGECQGVCKYLDDDCPALKHADMKAKWDSPATQQPAQEPVAWIQKDMECDDFDSDSVTCEKPARAADGWEWIPLYTTPPAVQRPWVGLTEEDFSAINQSCLTKLQAATSAESILKEKNNG